MIHATFRPMLKWFIVDLGPTYELGNCVKDNKQLLGYGLQAYRPICYYFYVFYVFYVFSKSKKRDFLRFFAVFHTFSRTMVDIL